MSEAVYLYKTNCDSCGSSDANSVYSNGNTHCFSCGNTIRGKSEIEVMEEIKEYNPSVLEYPETIRGINSNTLRKFNYGVSNGNHVTYYFDASGSIVAEKRRTKDKTFGWTGNAKSSCLFGQTLWKPNKKLSVTITEGEIDAMSISQLQQNKYPVVSVPNGANAAAKDIKKSIEWLLGFKEIVLCFDNDKVGQEAALNVAKLFPPKFVRLVTLPLKDANEMCKQGKFEELRNSLRDAKPYTPDGILSGIDILDRLENEEVITSYPFPDFLKGANEKLKGIRLSELVVFTAGSGSGKSALLKQLQYHYFNNSEHNQALIHLEETMTKTAKDLVGISMDVRLQCNEKVKKEEYMAKAKEIFSSVDSEGQHRLCLYDSFGSMDSEDLYNKIRFMVKGLDCKVIWLDHLSILVSGLGQVGDERRAIDSIMHELKSLTIELGCFIGLVVHLNNNTQTPFENGGTVTVNNLRGSGAIKQLSDAVVAISRNQQAECDIERNTSIVSILKNRYTGETGVCDKMFYNVKTGRFEIPKEDSFEGEGMF